MHACLRQSMRIWLILSIGPDKMTSTSIWTLISVSRYEKLQGIPSKRLTHTNGKKSPLFILKS